MIVHVPYRRVFVAHLVDLQTRWLCLGNSPGECIGEQDSGDVLLI